MAFYADGALDALLIVYVAAEARRQKVLALLGRDCHPFAVSVDDVDEPNTDPDIEVLILRTGTLEHATLAFLANSEGDLLPIGYVATLEEVRGRLRCAGVPHGALTE